MIRAQPRYVFGLIYFTITSVYREVCAVQRIDDVARPFTRMTFTRSNPKHRRMSTQHEKNTALETVFVDQRATARRLRKAKLVVTDGPDQGSEVMIGKTRLYVGRAAVNDFVLTDTSISNTHFEICVREDGYLLRDLGSTNGVTFAGLRIREIFIKPGTSFKAGNSSLRLLPSNEVVNIPLSTSDRFGSVLGKSVAMRELFATLEKVAPSELTVLLEGETGTGKEVVAHSIHQRSRRTKKPFIVLDCSSIPRDLMESTVFGHEKGSFTGAIGQHKGAFEQAAGGTVFLDEIGELDINLQPKLLRVLENRELKRVGGDKVIRTDVRVIAATNRDLRKMVNEGTFREDLYFRLSVIQLTLPPLRNRRADIPLLVQHFLDLFSETQQKTPPPVIEPDALEALKQHDWQGNIRELKNVMERAVSLCEHNTITRADLHLNASRLSSPTTFPPTIPPPTRETPSPTPNPPPPAPPTSSDDLCTLQIDLDQTYKEAKITLLDQFEHAYIERIFKASAGNISQSARSAGLTRYHLRELLKKHKFIQT